MVERKAAKPRVTLKGREAIDYAREHGLCLNQSIAPEHSGPGTGLSLEDALKLLEQDPQKVWLEIPAGVTPAD